MRIWLDPAKLINYTTTPGDISAVARTFNVHPATIYRVLDG